MEESDAKKMLDLCIYAYLNKNNLHAIAENFARESEIFPKTVAMNDGSLRSQATHPSFLAETGPVAVEHQMQEMDLEMDLGPKNEGDRSKKSN